MLGHRVKKNRWNVAHKPPNNARVDFKRRIRTKKEVYSHFQRSQKKLQSNIKVSPHFFFSLGHKKVGHTHTEN